MGVARDRDYGRLIVFGAGAVLTELIADVAVAPVPLNQARVRSLVESTKIGQILAGYRGGTRLDVDALVDTLIAVSVFAAERVDDVEAIDLNPVRVGVRGAVALDALVVAIGEDTRNALGL